MLLFSHKGLIEIILTILLMLNYILLGSEVSSPAGSS